MFRILRPLGAALFTLILLTACDSGRSTQVQPAKNIEDSFRVVAQPPVANDLILDRYLVGIQRSALEKEFLLRSEMILQAVVPSFQGLRSRIVAFREHGDQLVMLEATHGHVVDSSVPATLVLAKFPIVREQNGVLYFDLNAGFSHLYLAGDWYGSSGPEGRTYNPNIAFGAAPLSLNFIEEARFDANNTLIVTQVGQLRTTTPDGPISSPLKARYFFTTYRPDPAFKPVDMSSDFTQFGYFEVNPLLQSNGTRVLASKFQHTKPIVFGVSHNTPPEFRAAVKEGILYWNKAFGRDIMKAVDAPADARAPMADLNLIQWINWDDAGAAYADAQMDPRTGEILNAQVFMTSAFAVGGKASARRLLRQISARPSKPALRVVMKGFDSSSTCRRAVEANFAATLTEILSSPAVEDKEVLRAAQDYVRNVVAHEVGHTLGLRHNFAGSLAANYKPSDQPQILKQYFTQGTVDPNRVSSSSVMDYDNFIDALVAGHQMKHGRTAYSYDEMAIRHLYDGVAYSRSEVPPFCTDEGTSIWMDCAVWDSGPSTIESRIYFGQQFAEKVPLALMRSFVDAKSPTGGLAPIPLERVAFDAEALAKQMVQERGSFLASLEKASRLLAIERPYDVVDSINREEVSARKLDYAKQEIDRQGGLASLLAPWSVAKMQSLAATVDTMVDSGLYDKGVDESNNAYQFSRQEMELIRRRSKDVLAKIFELLPELEQNSLSAWTAPLAEHALSDEYASVLKDRVEEILLATTGVTVSGTVNLDDGTAITVQLPVFKHKHALRKAAYALLQREGKPSVEWGYAQREVIKGQLGMIIEAGFHGKWDHVETEGMDRPILRWYLENKEIYGGMDDVNSILVQALRERMK